MRATGVKHASTMRVVLASSHGASVGRTTGSTVLLHIPGDATQLPDQSDGQMRARRGEIGDEGRRVGPFAREASVSEAGGSEASGSEAGVSEAGVSEAGVSEAGGSAAPGE
eukprot:scaffold111364_cov53-Phaeocystis_antarctica.AAC.1